MARRATPPAPPGPCLHWRLAARAPASAARSLARRRGPSRALLPTGRCSRWYCPPRCAASAPTGLRRGRPVQNTPKSYGDISFYPRPDLEINSAADRSWLFAQSAAAAPSGRRSVLDAVAPCLRAAPCALHCTLPPPPPRRIPLGSAVAGGVVGILQGRGGASRGKCGEPLVFGGGGSYLQSIAELISKSGRG